MFLLDPTLPRARTHNTNLIEFIFFSVEFIFDENKIDWMPSLCSFCHCCLCSAWTMRRKKKNEFYFRTSHICLFTILYLIFPHFGLSLFLLHYILLVVCFVECLRRLMRWRSFQCTIRLLHICFWIFCCWGNLTRIYCDNASSGI